MVNQNEPPKKKSFLSGGTLCAGCSKECGHLCTHKYKPRLDEEGEASCYTSPLPQLPLKKARAYCGDTC